MVIGLWVTFIFIFVLLTLKEKAKQNKTNELIEGQG